MPLTRYANAFRERDVANYSTGKELDARAGVEPAFQRSERCDLPLVDPAMIGCPSRT